MLKVQRIDGEPVSVQIGAHEFACEDDTGEVTVPRELATGFRLSDIPEDISIKPVEKIEGHTIHVKNDVAISQFRDGAASTEVEEMFRRKFWDGETGLTPYVLALRQSIEEEGSSLERDFQDDGDYIFLHFDVAITEDLEIREAVELIDTTIERIHERADRLVGRRKDGLLGIFDRGSFDADLKYVLSGTQNVALLMADIDHFKQVNDRFGHQVGDLVLTAVARLIESKCDGKSRVAYRYGGEEMAVVLRGDCVATAAEFAESIRAEVETLRFDSNPRLKVTTSLGVAERMESDNVELIRQADGALYRAKEAGRNRVEFAKE
jgi:diguanylate cyclase (GGDEF)-like protein